MLLGTKIGMPYFGCAIAGSHRGGVSTQLKKVKHGGKTIEEKKRVKGNRTKQTRKTVFLFFLFFPYPYILGCCLEKRGGLFGEK